MLFLNCMVSDRIGFGNESAELIRDVSQYLGVHGGFAFKEYFRAVRFAIDGLGLEKGARVAISALAPQVYMLVLSEAGFDILPIDVDLDSSLMDVNELERGGR